MYFQKQTFVIVCCPVCHMCEALPVAAGRDMSSNTPNTAQCYTSEYNDEKILSYVGHQEYKVSFGRNFRRRNLAAALHVGQSTDSDAAKYLETRYFSSVEQSMRPGRTTL